MPLDPEAKASLEKRIEMGVLEPHESSPEEARALQAARPNLPGPEVASVSDHLAPGPHGDVPVRVYVPVTDDHCRGDQDNHRPGTQRLQLCRRHDRDRHVHGSRHSLAIHILHAGRPVEERNHVGGHRVRLEYICCQVALHFRCFRAGLHIPVDHRHSRHHHIQHRNARSVSSLFHSPLHPIVAREASHRWRDTPVA